MCLCVCVWCCYSHCAACKRPDIGGETEREGQRRERERDREGSPLVERGTGTRLNLEFGQFGCLHLTSLCASDKGNRVQTVRENHALVLWKKIIDLQSRCLIPPFCLFFNFDFEGQGDFAAPEKQERDDDEFGVRHRKKAVSTPIRSALCSGRCPSLGDCLWGRAF